MKTGKDQEEEKDREKKAFELQPENERIEVYCVGKKCPISYNSTNSSQVTHLEVNYFGNKLPNPQ